MEKDTEKGQPERTIYSVAGITALIRENLESGFPAVTVEGEISNCRIAPSGHAYFTIKDAEAVLSAVLFKGSRPYCDAELADGLKAVFHGGITVYAARGNYQLVVRSVRRSGQGDLHTRFEELKKKLHAEGLFRNEVKQPLPFHPRRVGIITSPGAAALQDILRVSRSRCPGIDIIIYPTQVQGVSAADEIVRAIHQAERDQLADVLLISRGGGSLEDLWPFNEERVARALATCTIPVVSGVGHEIDYTITDFVADLRAATPSAAAEAVFPDRAARLADIESSLEHARHLFLRLLREKENRVAALSGENLHRRLRRLVEQAAVALDERRERIRNAAALTVARARTRAATLLGRIGALDPLAPLRKGFSLVRDESGRVLRSAAGLAPGDGIRIRFGSGGAAATINSTETGDDNGH